MKFKQIPLTPYEQAFHEKGVATVADYMERESHILAIVEEADRIKIYRKFGETKNVKYCMKYLKLTRSLAYAFQGVARKSRVVPELFDAVEEGLSISMAHKIVSQITPENHAMWIERAKTLPQHDLEFLVSAASKRKKHGPKKTPISKDVIRMELDFPQDAFTALVRAQEVHKGTEVDVIKEALEMWLEKNDPVRKADRALKKRPVAEQNYSQAEFGKRVPFSARTLHEVNGRDRGQCQQILPDGTKCGSAKYPQIHHIKEVWQGGTNETDNLITLCSAHHRIHHQFSPHAWELSSPRATYVTH